MTYDKYYFAETATHGIKNRIVHNGFTVWTQTIQLL